MDFTGSPRAKLDWLVRWPRDRDESSDETDRESYVIDEKQPTQLWTDPEPIENIDGAEVIDLDQIQQPANSTGRLAQHSTNWVGVRSRLILTQIRRRFHGALVGCRASQLLRPVESLINSRPSNHNYQRDRSSHSGQLNPTIGDKIDVAIPWGFEHIDPIQGRLIIDDVVDSDSDSSGSRLGQIGPQTNGTTSSQNDNENQESSSSSSYPSLSSEAAMTTTRRLSKWFELSLNRKY